jgi:RNA polymerase sigma-70 factor (ECF subfamily)
MAGIGFDEFYASHFDTVARALVVAGAEREQARDAAQEAFARALRRWRHVREMDRPDGWVYVVAMNQLRDHWRRLSRSVPDEPVLVDNGAAIATCLSVRDAIATLPPRQRQAVVLRYLVDLPIADVAEAMNCAEGTVKAALHHALKAMRVELEDDDDAY